MAVRVKKRHEKNINDEGDYAVSLVSLRRKADTDVIVSMTPLEAEDEFNSLYEGSTAKNQQIIIEPPFVPSQLSALCKHNNVLQQCIHVMEVNVDGTGHQLTLLEGKTDSDEEKKRAESFFKEPYIGMSMVTLRRKLRVDLEAMGNAYVEVLRNAAGELVMLRYIDAKLIRIVRYDDAILAEKEIEREGKVETVKMWVRERRYVQKIGAKKLLYFREFGSTRQLNSATGEWAAAGATLPVQEQASELIHFIVDKDDKTPYGVPRWINQLPSNLGSRKSEIFNLDFFDAGGLPPAIVFVEGGTMGRPVKEQLLTYLGGGTRNKHRAAVVEVQPSSGSMEAVGRVGIKVERFGDAKTSDAMFQVYDENCEARTRGAFRLPTLFFGRATDFNFATAVTAYMVAEAQVFQPERVEFDELINKTIMKELKIVSYEYKSMPITLRNAELQIEAMSLVVDKVDGEDFVNTINDITGLTLEYSEKAEQAAFDREAKQPKLMGPDGKPMLPPKPLAGQKPGFGKPANGLPVRKSANDMVQLVAQWTVAMGMEKNGHSYTPVEKAEIITAVDALDSEERALFNALLATRTVGYGDAGLAELAESCCDVLSHTQVQ